MFISFILRINLNRLAFTHFNIVERYNCSILFAFANNSANPRCVQCFYTFSISCTCTPSPPLTRIRWTGISAVLHGRGNIEWQNIMENVKKKLDNHFPDVSN